MIQNGRNQQQEVMDIPTEMMQENHVSGFFDAVKAKNKNLLSCTIDDAFQSTATVQLGMISYYTGTEVKWDSQKQIITDNKKATELLARPYRDGYKRPKA